jgi:hypothetical protein
MESKPKNLGRAYLIGKLQAQGLSRRQAVLTVNVILERMIHALKSRVGSGVSVRQAEAGEAPLQQALGRHRRLAGESGSAHDRA